MEFIDVDDVINESGDISDVSFVGVVWADSDARCLTNVSTLTSVMSMLSVLSIIKCAPAHFLNVVEFEGQFMHCVKFKLTAVHPQNNI
jgi:hypothetical protein